MSSILPQFQYFKFNASSVSCLTPEKHAIVIPGAPVKTTVSRWSNFVQDEYDSDDIEHPYSLVHPAPQEWTYNDEPMTISELELDSDEEDDVPSVPSVPSVPYANVTLTRGSVYSSDDEDSLLDEPMTIDEFTSKTEEPDSPSVPSVPSVPYANVTLTRGSVYSSDDEDSLLDELMTDMYDVCDNPQSCFDEESSQRHETVLHFRLSSQDQLLLETCPYPRLCGVCDSRMQYVETYEFDCGHSLCYECYYLEFVEETDGVCPVSDCKKHVKNVYCFQK